MQKHNELKEASSETPEGEDKKEEESKAAGKKKVRCNCKKKCKGPCKWVKNAENKAKEEVKAKKDEDEYEENIDTSIPYFPGRKNPDDHGGVKRDIKIEGFSIAFGGSNILLDNTSLSLNWG